MARVEKTIHKSITIRTKNGTLQSSSKLQVLFYKSSLGNEPVKAWLKRLGLDDRKTIGEEVIGPEFMRFMPFLFSLFTFVLVNNLFGIFPLLQFPTMSRIGFPISITICTYLVYHFVSVKHKGLLPYLKEICFMPGIPKPVYLILTPVEIATYFITRPLTLAMRLFANMFAGHLLLLIFTLGGEYLLHSGLIFKFMSLFSFGFAVGLTFFEFGIQCLQAYIFTLLSALYIAGALADEH